VLTALAYGQPSPYDILKRRTVPTQVYILDRTASVTEGLFGGRICFGLNYREESQEYCQKKIIVCM
jgi:hypothetical protein